MDMLTLKHSLVLIADFENFKIMKNLFSFLLMIFILNSCEKFPEPGECEIYLIKKDEHYAEGFNPEKFEIFSIPRCNSKISFTFVIDESMFYNPEIENFKNGHNKVRGIVCGNKNEILANNILKYSARITWRCSEIGMDIGFIIHLPVLENHIQGILLENVQSRDEIFCIIEDRGFEGFYFYAKNLNTFEFAEKIISKYGAHDPEVYGLLESPYFGGHENSPHNISIKICTN